MAVRGWEMTKRLLKKVPFVVPVYMKLLLLKERWMVERRMAADNRAFVREDFESIFEKKQDPWEYYTPHQQERIKLLCEQIPGDVSSILEIGSAEGFCTVFLAQKANYVTSIDISKSALERARLRCHTTPNLHFVQADLLRPPFCEPFDAIVCAGVLVYFPETVLLRQAIQNLLRLLRPGGTLVLENMWKRSGGARAGSTIHDLFLKQPDIQLIKLDRHNEYGISVFQKRS